MTLGQRIQEGRAALGLSQEGLGEKLGVSRQAVSKWEADAAVPDTDKLIALSKLFEVTLNQLLQVEEPAGGRETALSDTPEAAGPETAEGPPQKKEGPTLQKIVAWCLAGAMVWALADARREIAELRSWVTRLEYLTVENTATVSGEGLVRDFRFEDWEDGLKLDLTPEGDFDGSVVFELYSAGKNRDSVTGKRQATGNYTAQVDVRDWKAPILVQARLVKEGSRHTQPLVWFINYEGSPGSRITYWDRERTETVDPVSSLGFSLKNDVLHVDMRAADAFDGQDVVFEVFDSQSNYRRVEEVTQTDDTLYSASVELGDMAGEPYTLFAVFSDGEKTRTEALLRINSCSNGNVKYDYLYRK